MGAPGYSRRVADELPGERERGAALPDPRRPMEEECVRGPLAQRGSKEGFRLFLLRKGLEAVHG